MELEEAKKRCNKIVTTKFNYDYSIDNVDKEAIKTVLQASKDIEETYNDLAKNWIPKKWVLKKWVSKKKIEDKIEELKEENEVITQEEYYARSYIRKFLKELLEEK